MKIAVLNGSPKGEESVTMQYVKYMHQLHPDLTLSFHNISQRIKGHREISQGAAGRPGRREILRPRALGLSPVLLPRCRRSTSASSSWCFEGRGASAFRSKFAAVLTTSLHFFDHTAHNYMRAICDDLGMKFAGAYSASMYDLVGRAERTRFGEFAAVMLDAVKNDMPAARACPPIARGRFPYKPARAERESGCRRQNRSHHDRPRVRLLKPGEDGGRAARVVRRRGRGRSISATWTSRAGAWGASSAGTTTPACTGTQTSIMNSSSPASRKRTSSFSASRRGTGTARPRGRPSLTGAFTTTTRPCSPASS